MAGHLSTSLKFPGRFLWRFPPSQGKGPGSEVGHVSHIQEPSIWPCSPRISHNSVVRASNRYLEGHGFDSRCGLRNSVSEYFDLRAFLRYLPRRELKIRCEAAYFWQWRLQMSSNTVTSARVVIFFVNWSRLEDFVVMLVAAKTITFRSNCMNIKSSCHYLPSPWFGWSP